MSRDRQDFNKEWSVVRLRVAASVATITLNRPDRLNALTADMCDELVEALDEANDHDARVVVVTGEGRAFCAGADVRGGSGRPLPIHDRYTFFNRLEDHPAPTIAAINGACIGGGLELALCCDLRIAAETAKLGLGESKLGVIPAGGGTVRLPRLIGPARAKELMFFGDSITGAEARDLGIVNAAVPSSELDAVVEDWSSRLAASAPKAISAIKRSVNVGGQMGVLEATQLEGALAREVLRSADATEGMQAFAEKRAPKFTGE